MKKLVCVTLCIFVSAFTMARGMKQNRAVSVVPKCIHEQEWLYVSEVEEDEGADEEEPSDHDNSVEGDAPDDNDGSISGDDNVDSEGDADTGDTDGGGDDEGDDGGGYSHLSAKIPFRP